MDERSDGDATGRLTINGEIYVRCISDYILKKVPQQFTELLRNFFI